MTWLYLVAFAVHGRWRGALVALGAVLLGTLAERDRPDHDPGRGETAERSRSTTAPEHTRSPVWT